MKHAGTLTDGQLLSGDAGVPVDDTKLILWQESRNAGGGHKAGCDMTISSKSAIHPQHYLSIHHQHSVAAAILSSYKHALHTEC